MKKTCFLLLFFVTSIVTAAPADDWSYLFTEEGSFLIKGEGEYDWSKVFFVGDDGVLKITGAGHPIAFIQTREVYENFEIQFDFRWPDKPGNSGIQLYSRGKPYYQIWPECIEVQMAHKNVGAFWLLGQHLQTRPEQIPKNPDWKNKREFFLDAENPVGQWNHMRIVSKDRTIDVYLNDKLVNRA